MQLFLLMVIFSSFTESERSSLHDSFTSPADPPNLKVFKQVDTLVIMSPDTPGINPFCHPYACQDFTAVSFIIMREILQYNFHDTICHVLLSTFLVGWLLSDYEYHIWHLKKNKTLTETQGEKKSHNTYQLGSVMEHRLRNALWVTLFYTKVNNAVRNKLNL